MQVVIMSDISGYLELIPTHNHWKLDKELDWDNDYGRDLDEIAKYFSKWQQNLQVHLKLNQDDLFLINSVPDPVLQRKKVLEVWKSKNKFNATYRNLLKCVAKGDHEAAKKICSLQMFQEELPQPTEDAGPIELDVGSVSKAEYGLKCNGVSSYKLYEAYDRGKQLAHLKLHDGGRITPPIHPRPYQQAHGAHGYYNMTAKRHGVALIINNEHFKAHADRKGTDRDEYNLIETFRFLGYRPIVYHDLTSAEICSIFGNLDAFLTNYDSKATAKVENDSFVCCFLSYIEKGSIFGSDGRMLSCDEIEYLVGESKTLHGKPKIFFSSGSWLWVRS